MADEIRAAGRPVEVLRIQQAGGTEPTISKGREIVGRMLAETEKTPRVPIAVSDLIVGTECGGSDATSGIAANPAVGHAFDLLVDSGAAVIFEETLEMLGCDEIAARRTANRDLAGELRRVIAKAESFSRQSPHFSIGPGNVTGGLTTIEEKSMGAFAKSGSRPISGIIKVAQRPPASGLYLLDTVPDPSPFHYGYSNPNDSEDIMALISCGAQVIVFTTGRGSVIGSVISPVLKVCGNPQTYARMSGDMDVNAGRIVLGEASIAQVGREIYDRVLAVAGGEPTAAEVLGHQEYCIPYKHQDLCANV
jgi:altronate hydrolase